jgi:hypothetical protein
MIQENYPLWRYDYTGKAYSLNGIWTSVEPHLPKDVPALPAEYAELKDGMVVYTSILEKSPKDVAGGIVLGLGDRISVLVVNPETDSDVSGVEHVMADTVFVESNEIGSRTLEVYRPTNVSLEEATHCIVYRDSVNSTVAVYINSLTKELNSIIYSSKPSYAELGRWLNKYQRWLGMPRIIMDKEDF